MLEKNYNSLFCPGHITVQTYQQENIRSEIFPTLHAHRKYDRFMSKNEKKWAI